VKDAEMERRGDTETERHGDAQIGRHGDAVKDAEMERCGDTVIPNHDETLSASPRPPLPASQSDLRILLWDIDGTLIHSLRIGAYKEYTIPKKCLGRRGVSPTCGSPE